MRWPRDEWTDALWQADVTPLELLVGLAYARRAGDRTVSWVAESELQSMTGLSRDATRRARAGLVDTGWLVLETRARQQHAARYSLRIPGQPYVSQTPETYGSRTAQTYVSRTSESPDVRERTADVRETSPSDVRETTSDVREKAPKVVTTPPPPTTPADELWMALVDSLPAELAHSLTRGPRINDALARHVDEGWTPGLLAGAARARSWTGTGGGAVVTWLTNLDSARRGQPVRASTRPPWCGGCNKDTRMAEDEANDYRPFPCPVCHPTAGRLAS